MESENTKHGSKYKSENTQNDSKYSNNKPINKHLTLSATSETRFFCQCKNFIFVWGGSFCYRIH